MIFVVDLIWRVGRVVELDDVWVVPSCRMPESGCRCWCSSLACSWVLNSGVGDSGSCSL